MNKEQDPIKNKIQ